MTGTGRSVTIALAVLTPSSPGSTVSMRTRLGSTTRNIPEIEKENHWKQASAPSDEAGAQPRADRIHHHHHPDGHEEDGRGGRVVDHPEIGLEVEADAAGAAETEHGGRADVGLETIEDIREKEREYLRQHAESQDLQARSACRRDRIHRTRLDPFDRLGTELGE